MILKKIGLRARSGRRADYLRLQRRWNEVMARQPGFMWCHVGIDADDPDSILIVIAFSTRDALDRFMAGPHDELVEETLIADTYGDISVEVFDVVDPEPSGLVALSDHARGSAAATLVDLGQLYRISAVVRRAVEMSLFDAIADADGDAGSIARAVGADETLVGRVIAVLAGIGLVMISDSGEVSNGAVAQRYLRWSSPASLCHLVLHDARPELFERWSAPDGVGEKHGAPPVERFSDAMTAIAQAGQADALVEALERAGVPLDSARLLDVGGALGDYARAIVTRWPGVQATVIDLPEVVALARTRGLDDPPRIDFEACDYRAQLPVGPFDVVLLSNIVRGETPAELSALLERTGGVLDRAGIVVVHDLLAVDEAGTEPRSAALFGLHLPDAANPTVTEFLGLLHAAGFGVTEVTMVEDFVSSNVVVTARR